MSNNCKQGCRGKFGQNYNSYNTTLQGVTENGLTVASGRKLEVGK